MSLRMTFSSIILLLPVFFAVAVADCRCVQCFSVQKDGCDNQANWSQDRLSCPGGCGGFSQGGFCGKPGSGTQRQYHAEYRMCYRPTEADNKWLQSQLHKNGIYDNCTVMSASQYTLPCDGTNEQRPAFFVVTALIALTTVHMYKFLEL